MKRPDFIIGGATRSGLGSLVSTLDRHPQIFVPRRKEHRFFMQGAFLESLPEPVKDGFDDVADTTSQERVPEGRVLHGEQEFDPVRAHQGCPNAKVIFMLRNPVERAYIQFWHAFSEKKETVRSFENAIEAEISGLRSPETTGRCWLYKNQYQKHLEHWLSFYPKEHILILIYEEWVDKVGATLGPVEEFLGLKPKSLVVTGNMREAEPRKTGKFSRDTRDALEEMFGVDKEYVANLLGREIKAWARG